MDSPKHAYSFLDYNPELNTYTILKNYGEYAEGNCLGKE